MVVELVGAYPVHDDLGIGSDEKVEGRAIGTVAFVGFGQRPGRDPQWAAVGLGDEAACGVGLEPEHSRVSSGSLLGTGVWPSQRSLPDVLCKRRGILYFAGEPARIIGPDTLRGGNARVPILLRRRNCSHRAALSGTGTTRSIV